MSKHFFSRFFPTPEFLRLGAVGLDFSDASVRMMELKETPAGILPKRFFAYPLPEGVLTSGKIVDESKLAEVLIEAKKKHRFRYARVSISEPQIYSFPLALDAAAAVDIESAIELVIEEYIPLKLSETVFDYTVIASTEENIIVQVTAMSIAASETLLRVLERASIVPVSFELEGEALARALIAPGATEQASKMIVDSGAHRTGIAIVSRGAVVFTATIDFGGMRVTEAIAKALSVSNDEAEKFKREIGLSSPKTQAELFEAMTLSLNVLKDEINRRYIYWHEKRQFADVFPAIDQLYLVGGDSNLLGLNEYLRAALRVDVVRANPWQNCVSFDEAVPELTRERSMSFATAIGLALSDMPEVSV